VLRSSARHPGVDRRHGGVDPIPAHLSLWSMFRHARLA
jgi:hypothetical protein